jgi:hypothetical protein
MKGVGQAAWCAMLAITIATGVGCAWADDGMFRPAWPGESPPAGQDGNGLAPAPPVLSVNPDWPDAGSGAAGPMLGPMAPPPMPPGSPLAAPPLPSPGPLPAEPPLLVFARQPVVVEWYTRFDYLQWNERHAGSDLDSEHGTLYTLGCSRRFGADRFCAELFTGTMNFGGLDDLGQTADATTTYLGLRGEYEWVWDLCPRGWPSAQFFAGVGTRFWIRDVKDGTVVGSNAISVGHQENWWTFYPYLGLEKRWPVNFGEEIYARGRLGCTVFTYEFTDLNEGTPLYPRPDLTGQVEVGFRHDQLFIAAYFEAMTWNASPSVRGSFQPLSQMFTTGLKLGFCF